MNRDRDAEAIQQWQDTAQYWAKHHHTIRTMFAPLTRALIEEARIVTGDAVIDVAGGAGEPSLTIAEIVGAQGSVMCTDPVAEMIVTAQSEARSRRLSNVQFRQCTADSLPFVEDLFDAAVCRLGVMFFPDPLNGVREMLRVTKPGKYVALAVWGKTEVNPYSYLVTQVLARHVKPTAVDPNAPDAFRFSEQGKLAGLLTAAGAIDVVERVVSFELVAPISPVGFWAMRSEVSETLRAKLTRMSEQERAQIAAEVLEAVGDYFVDNQMKFPAQMIIVSGAKRNDT